MLKYSIRTIESILYVGVDKMKAAFNRYWPIYKNLEEETLQLSKYIQFTDNQLGVYSTHIADLLAICAMEIESLSKELYWENGGEKVYGKNGKERDLFFDVDCVEFLNGLWGICEKELLVSSTKFYFEKPENRKICPLHNANKRGKTKWNKAYQAVKHDRKNSLNQGTIENLISAMGALFILNLYYMDDKIELGTTHTPSKAFDSRMGSEIFSATYTDVTVAVQMDAGMTDNAIPEKLKANLNSSIYIIKYTTSALTNIFNAFEKDSQQLAKDLLESESLIKYYEQHPEEIKNISEENVITLVSRFLGSDYIRNNHSLGRFGQAFMEAKKEAILNKNQPIYG